MKKLFSNLACAALVAAGMMSASGAQAQLYVTGGNVDGQTSEWNPSSPLVVELQDGYYTFQATGEFKMSTVMGDWNAFNGGTLRPSAWTLDGNVATATLSNGDANVKAPAAWASSKVTYKVDEAYSTVTATVGEVEKTVFYVTGSPFPGGWGAFNDAVKMTETSENVFTYVAEEGIAGDWKISAKGYSPNFGAAGTAQPVLNELYELADGGGSLMTAFQGKCTITFKYNPDGVSTLLVTGDAQQEIDYTKWYLNIVGDFNSWDDNGVSFDAEGIAKRENVAVGNGGFKIKVWNGAADMWHCSGEALPLDVWTAVVGNSDQLMTVEGAKEGDLYNFEYNAKTDEVFVTKVGGDEPEPPVENVATFNFAAPTTLTPSFPDWTENYTEPWVADNTNTMIDLADVVLTNNGVEFANFVNEGVSTTTTPWRIYRQSTGVQELRWYKNRHILVSAPDGYYVQSVEFYSPRTAKQSNLGNVAVGVSGGAKLSVIETLPEGMGCGFVYYNTDQSVVSQSFFVTSTTSAQLVKVYYEPVTTGVDSIEAAEAAEAVYYNLQGVRVANPENGLYIRVQGKTVSKVYVK